MEERNALVLLGRELTVMVDPLRRVIADPVPPHELALLLRAAGWSLPLTEIDLDDVTAAWAAVLEVVDALPGALSADQLSEVVPLLEAARDGVGAVRDLGAPLEAAMTAASQGPVGDVLADLAEDLFAELVLRYLRRRLPRGFAVLRAVGVIALREVAERPASAGAPPLRRAGTQLRLDPQALIDLLGDPVSTLRDLYVDGALDDSVQAQVLHLLLARSLRPLASRLGGDLLYLPPWADIPGLPAAERDSAGRTAVIQLLMPSADGSPIRSRIEVTTTMLSSADRGVLDRPGPGVEITPVGLATTSATAGEWELSLDVAAGAGTVFAGPGGVTAELDAGLEAALRVVHLPTEPLRLGAENGTRLELPAPELGLSLSLVEEPDVEVEILFRAVRLVAGPGDGDSFIASVLPIPELDAVLDLGLLWSLRDGLRLSGQAALTGRLLIGKELLGIVTLESVEYAATIGGGELGLDLGLTALFTLGPFQAWVQGIGLRLRAIARSDGAGAIGPFDLEVVVKPPTAAGFSITSPAVNGGGVIGYDPLIGRYFGVISLDVVAVGLSAMVVVDTRLPGDPDGYALFASIFAEFPSLPLGFGFFLSGVGGLLCLNRGMDGEAIAAGLHDGAIDALLFPENVLEDATFILGQLDNWFPIAPGSTAIGIAAAIDWGTPEPIITGELGIVVSLPEGEIAVLGSVSMALPESDPLLSLHMDTLGLIDPSNASVMVVASLYDSSLLGTIMLSGDMATYAVFSGQPYFLMSVGGYHPGFCPPVPLPPAVADLRPFGFEVALADDVWFRLESYVAIASNAFQFGSLAVLEASTKFLLTTYTARGEVGFDVLLTVKPFSFIADAHVLVSVTAGGADLIHAELRVHLSGPKPWLATGFGEFEFLGIDVRFDFSVGGMPSVTAPPREPVHEQVTTALSDDRACERVATTDNGVLAGSGDPQDGVAVRPDGSLRIVQTVAPLDRRIEVFGQCGVEGPDLLSVDDAGIDGVDSATWSPVLDYFAPAMFDEMTDAEKLSSPSYELMTAGVALSVPGISIGSMTAAVTPEPEVFVLTARTRALGLGAALNSTVTDLFSRTATRLTGPRPAPTVSATRFTVNSPGWAQIDPESGVAESPPTAYHDALSALRRRRLVDPAARITPDPGARRTT